MLIANCHCPSKGEIHAPECLSYAFIAVKRHHDEGTGAGLQVQRFICYHHGGKHSRMQGDTMLKCTRVLHLETMATEGDHMSNWA